MKSNIINISKGVSGYLLFVFLSTVFMNAAVNDDDTGKHSEPLITLTEFIVNCISYGSVLGIIGLYIDFTESHNYSLKKLALYFILLYIATASYVFGSKIGIVSISNEMIYNSFLLFVLLSFISFFLIIRKLINK